MKIRFAVLFSFIACLLVGCSGTRPLGKIGSVEFYAVRARSLDGPNITALVTRDQTNNRVEIQTSAGGPGVGHTFIAAAGNVGSSAAFGLSLRPNRVNVNNSSDVSNDSSSSARSSSDASAEANSASSGGSTTVTGGHIHNNGNTHGGGNILHGNPHN